MLLTLSKLPRRLVMQSAPRFERNFRARSLLCPRTRCRSFMLARATRFAPNACRSLIIEPNFIMFLHLKMYSSQVRRISEDVQRRIGDGVSKEAQRLFNSLHKALSPCAWSQQTIVVGTPGSEDEVRIAPPYTNATCSGKVRLLPPYVACPCFLLNALFAGQKFT